MTSIVSAPSPSSTRGQIVLQPAYFSSSAFVLPARADVESLLREFSLQYTSSSARPFALFKHIWQAHGWTWIHFKVLDARSRVAFLRVMMRLFSERIRAVETLLNRAAALFGLYAVFHMQPTIPAPLLSIVAHVEVTCDHYREILMLPDAFDGELLRPHILYVQSSLLEAQVFQVLPHSELHPLSPRALPREVVVEDADDTPSTAEGRKTKGRPSKRERIKKTRDSLLALDRRCQDDDDDDDDVVGSPPSATRAHYALEKSALVNAIGGDVGWEAGLREAATMVTERRSSMGFKYVTS